MKINTEQLLIGVSAGFFINSLLKSPSIGAITDNQPPGKTPCLDGKFSTYPLGRGVCSYHGGTGLVSKKVKEPTNPNPFASDDIIKKPEAPRTRQSPVLVGYESGYDTTGLPYFLLNLKQEIPYEVGRRAHMGTSFDPEKRARQEQESYAQYLVDNYRELAKGRTPEQLAVLNTEFQRFKEGYKKRFLEKLYKRSRLLSTMITGPANFPVRRQEKANNAYDNFFRQFLDWEKKVLNKIKRNPNIYPSAVQVIKSGESDTIAKLENKIAQEERRRDMLKEVNKIIRAGKDVKENLLQLGLSEKTVLEVLKPDYAGRTGIPQFTLTNLGANIRRLKQRLEGEKMKLKRIETQGTRDLSFAGGRIVENVEENRLQILFDDIPDVETRTQLKKSGFRWSPKNKAWQRQNTANALYTAKKVVGISGLPQNNAGKLIGLGLLTYLILQ